MSAPTWRHPITGRTRQAHKRPQARVGDILIGWEPADAAASALVGDFTPADAVPLGELLTQVATATNAESTLTLATEGDMVPVPAKSATKGEWVEFVLATEDISRDEVEAMTKPEIVERFGA